MRAPWKAIGTFFYLGTFPFAPGTVGSAAAAAIYLAICLAGLPDAAVNGILIGLIVLLSALCVPAASWAERTCQRKDPPFVVLDEVVGYFISVLFFPAGSFVAVAIGAFFLFRFFDIIKPPPARSLEKIDGGLGVLLDDVTAGIWANLALRAGMAIWAAWL